MHSAGIKCCKCIMQYISNGCYSINIGDWYDLQNEIVKLMTLVLSMKIHVYVKKYNACNLQVFNVLNVYIQYIFQMVAIKLALITHIYLV